MRAEVDRKRVKCMFLHQEVVEDVLDPNTEITLSDAHLLSPDFELGDVLEFGYHRKTLVVWLPKQQRV